MYTIKDKVYADAGNILVKSGAIGFQMVNEGKIIEKPLDLSTLSLSNDIIKISGFVVGLLSLPYTYENYKTLFIKKRYSNDDQLAIILNKDESEADLEKYQKMQEWRSWSGNVARAIIEKVNN